jgi:drug/metabolite transporter (DMT)-like permease
MTNLKKAHIAIALASLLFGMNYWIGKKLMPDFMDPYQITFYRLLGAFLICYIYEKIWVRVKIDRKDLLKIALLSFTGVAISQLLFFVGLSYTSPVDASIIHAFSPIVILLMAAFIVKEKITGVRIVGIVIGAVGAIMIVAVNQNSELAPGSLKGNLLVLANITLYSYYIVMIKPLMAKYNVFTLMKWLFLFAIIFVAPFSIKPVLETNFSAFTGYAWFSLFYVIIGTTFLAYILTVFALRYLSSVVVGFYIYIQPLVSVIAGLLLFSEKLTFVKIIAGLLIFLGIFLVNRQKPEPGTGKITELE